jgi:hypothetical protein
MAGAPPTGALRIRKGFPGLPGKRDAPIIAEQGGLRYRSVTNDAGRRTVRGFAGGRLYNSCAA